ncbi:MAG: hypothetical protein AB7U98_12210 [Candidatus Nitrosocosmicus sp.]
MNKSNIQTNKKQTKNVSLYATISVMVAFALIASPIVSTIDGVYGAGLKKSGSHVAEYKESCWNTDWEWHMATSYCNKIATVDGCGAEDADSKESYSVDCIDGDRE